jgi:CRISPR system Cascade subunit CasA
MAALNLLRDPWIPVLTRSGRRLIVRPSDLTLGIDTDPIVEIAWPRPDFRVAQVEFLIGLLTTACQPDGNSVWERLWDRPPAPDELDRHFTPLAEAFDLDGAGPRFLQDLDDLGDDYGPVGGLLIEQPGGNTAKNNADLFVKRGRVEVIGRSTAAIALYALQSFAPAGGAGHRTSLRGGGPLTSLAVPPGRDSLWHFLWLNVAEIFDFEGDGAPGERLGDTFAWLGPTRVSDKTGRITTGDDVHPTQCFWGMPRRIRLDFEPNVDALPCDLTGLVEDIIVRRYVTRPSGVNYSGVRHPLTPTYRIKPTDTEWLPVHPQPGGIAYRHWLSFVQETPTRRPAACVVAAEHRLGVLDKANLTGARLRLFGYDMDNMKARAFVETEMPLFVPSPAAAPAFGNLLGQLVAGAVEVAGLVGGAVRFALGRDGGAALDLIRENFFKDTEQAFFAAAKAGLVEIEGDPSDVELTPGLARAWLADTLRPAAERAFDCAVPTAALADAGNCGTIEKLVKARLDLLWALRGYGPGGQRLFKALNIAAPESMKRKPKRGATSEATL